MDNLDIIGAEVCAVLNKIPKDEYNKLPEDIRENFSHYAKEAENINIDLSKRFEEQNISKEAKDIIFALSLDYWLPYNEKQEILRKMRENERKDVLQYENNVTTKKDIFSMKNEKLSIIKHCDKKWYEKMLEWISSKIKR